jgi:AraC-like DNA-binding protein
MQEASPWRTIRQDHSRNDGPLTKELCSVLRKRLMSGPCTAEEAASLFTMSRRTLTRYLENEGLTFRTLTNQIRFEITCRMLAETTMTLTEIAGALHYAEPSVLSRFFRLQSGFSPSEWRTDQRSQHERPRYVLGAEA